MQFHQVSSVVLSFVLFTTFILSISLYHIAPELHSKLRETERVTPNHLSFEIAKMENLILSVEIDYSNLANSILLICGC